MSFVSATRISCSRGAVAAFGKLATWLHALSVASVTRDSKESRGPTRRGSMSSVDPTCYFRGQRVLARYKGRKDWWRGTITRADKDGTFVVIYDDDAIMERGVKRIFLQPVPASEDEEPPASSYFQEGAHAIAKYRGGTVEYPGVIQRCQKDGRYAIAYDDGDFEINVEEASIREPETMVRLRLKGAWFDDSRPAPPPLSPGEPDPAHAELLP
eukprot:6674922-Prymnesium_polylepis.1